MSEYTKVVASLRLRFQLVTAENVEHHFLGELKIPTDLASTEKPEKERGGKK